MIDELVPEERTVNREFYLKVPVNLLMSIERERERGQIWKSVQLVLLARKCSSNLVNREVVVTGRPPRLPDLAAAGLFLFSKVEIDPHIKKILGCQINQEYSHIIKGRSFRAFDDRILRLLKRKHTSMLQTSVTVTSAK
jgi:hypothetical protein